jgi:zinc D-Ala-D-Ala carboxypeptidase
MKYFTISELCKSDTAKARGIDNTPTEEVKRNLEALIENVLDPLREWYGKPIYISSGYRCPKLNKAVGGVDNSFHKKGFAADIDMGDKKDNQPIFDYIKNNLPFTELGWEGKGRWVHVAYVQGKENEKEVFYA